MKERILILENDMNDAMLSLEYLKGELDFIYKITENRKEFLDALEEFKPTLILSDFNLPQYTGLNALRDVLKRSPEMPFIIVTGSVDEETAVECLKQGAWNYVLKDNLMRLAPAVKNALKIKKEQREKSKYNERFRMIFDHSLDIIFILNANNGKINEVNHAVKQILGYEPENLVGRAFCDLCPEEHKAILQDLLKNISSDKLVFNNQEFLKKDGSSCLTEFNARVIPWLDEKVILITLRDITERKNMEERVKDSEHSFKNIFNSTIDAIYVQDKKGTFLNVNTAAEKMYGYTRKELIGKTPEIISAPGKNDISKVSIALKKAFKGEPQQFEFWGKRKNGEIFPKIVRLSKGIYNKKTAVFAFAHDISKQRKIDEELKNREKFNYALFEYNPVENIIVNTDGRIVKTNMIFKQSRARLPELGSVMYKDYASEHSIDMYKLMMQCIKNDETISIEKSEYKGKFWDITIAPFPDGAIISANEVTERLIGEQRIRKLNHIFENLGSNPQDNIRIIVKSLNELLNGVCAFYNRLDDERKSLIVWAEYNAPDDLLKIDKPDGHICYEATIKGGNKPVIINDLEGTEYEKTDPNVLKYGLRSYLGSPVHFHNDAIGSLCIVDTKKREFHQSEIDIISTLAKALSIEEERKYHLEKIESQLKEREFLLQEIHHRVNNNLQILISLLNMQKTYIESSSARNALNESVSRIRAMAMVHEKMYINKNFTEINFKNYIQSLTTNLYVKKQVNPKRIKVIYDIEDVSMSINKAIPCGLILNELISNAMVHAFSEVEDGIINIILKSENNIYTLILKDNGKGISEKYGIKNSKTIGFYLTDMMLSQLYGTIDINSDDGTTIKITFPE